MKKHILFVTENQSVPYDQRVWREAVAAKELGYRVSIISPVNERSSKKKSEVIDRINVYRHYTPHDREADKFRYFLEFLNALFWELSLAIRIFLRYRFHVIHAGNPPDHIFLIALLFKPFGVKYIFDHHDLSPEKYIAKFGRRDTLYKALLFMEKMNFTFADIVIATNESYRNIAVRRGGKDERDVFVVRNGPDLSRVLFLPPNDTLKNGFDFLVAYLGAIGFEEGVDVLLRAVRYITHERKRQNIKFMIVGMGPYREEMVKLAQEMDIEKYVHFTGFVSYKELYEILSTADVCVNPEFKNEFTDKSTMLKIMDYMTFGKPIVQFDVTEGRITATDASIYVANNDEKDFANAIMDLLDDPQKRKRMGEIGRKRIVDSLNWDKQKINLEAAYRYLKT